MPPKRPRVRPSDTAVRHIKAVAVFALTEDGTLMLMERQHGLTPCLRQAVIAGSDPVTGVLGVLTIKDGRIVVEPMPAPEPVLPAAPPVPAKGEPT